MKPQESQPANNWSILDRLVTAQPTPEKQLKRRIEIDRAVIAIDAVLAQG